jgi:hypothetical protein
VVDALRRHGHTLLPGPEGPGITTETVHAPDQRGRTRRGGRHWPGNQIKCYLSHAPNTTGIDRHYGEMLTYEPLTNNVVFTKMELRKYLLN